MDLGGKNLKDVYSSVTFELDGTTVSDKYSNEVLNHNWAGSNFSKRVWKNQEALSSILQSSLLESFSSGKSNRQISTELSELTNYGRHAANRLIRTETSYMVNSADLESSKRRGIKAKKFEAHLDSRTSRICRKHNQIVIPIDKIKIGENAPPLHPYCRSFLSDLLEDWDYETEEELEALISDEYKDKAKRIDVRELSAPYNGILAAKDKKDINEFEQFKQVLENSPNMPKSLGEFLDLKYNNVKEYELLRVFVSEIGHFNLSKDTPFEQFKQISEDIDNKLIGLVILAGIEIKSKSNHFISRVIGNTETKRKGVDLDLIYDVLVNDNTEALPVKVDKNGNKSIKLRFNGVEVSVNPETGNLIQVNPRSRGRKNDKNK